MPNGDDRPCLRLGSAGAVVARWQALVGVAPDGAFGPLTLRATVAFQRVRGLLADGIVGPKTWATALGEPEPLVDKLVPLDPTSLPFVEAASYTRCVRGPDDIRWVVLHSMEAPEKPDTAEAVAEWFAGRRGAPPRASAHVCVDANSVVLCVPLTAVAWGAKGGNLQGIHVEHAGYAAQRDDAGGWADAYSEAMLRLSARIVAWICREYELPAVALGPEDLLAGKVGITTHAAITRAFRVVGGHLDPGGRFPMQRYIEFVQEALAP